MGLFGFGKKKEEKAASCGCSGGCAPAPKVEEEMAMCDCGSMCKVSDIEAAKKASEEGSSVKVLGSGCKKCNDLEANVKEALAEMGKDTAVEHVTDFSQIAAMGVMTTPALVINNKVVSTGKVLKKDEAKKLLEANM